MGCGRFEHGGNVYAHPGCVDFSASLNPLGMPRGVREALAQNVDAFSLYPDPRCARLTDALARLEKVPREWIVACAGATDAFARICAVVRPQEAMVCSPCYSGYEQSLEQVGCAVRYHVLLQKDDFALVGLPAGGVCQDVVFLTNPNNPTGRCIEREVLVTWLEDARKHGTTVVLDECFIDLTLREGSNCLLGTYPNLVLVKALTKSFALAGLRVGYAMCSDERFAERLRAAGQPWAVSVPAQLAGEACLCDEGYLERSRRLVDAQRTRLVGALRSHGLRVVPGEANYLLFKGPVDLGKRLLAAGILIRSCANFRGLDDSWYRIAVRSPEENDRLMEALGEVM